MTVPGQIDFHMVAADFGINPAAARMRWSRLRKNIALNSGFKDDPNVALLYGQGKKKRKSESGIGGGGKKGKFIKGEGDDDEEAAVAGDDWRIKREVKVEDEEGFGSSGRIGVGVGVGGPGEQADASVAGVAGAGVTIGGTATGRDAASVASSHGAGRRIDEDAGDVAVAAGAEPQALAADDGAPTSHPQARATTAGPRVNPDSDVAMDHRSTSLGLAAAGPGPDPREGRLAAPMLPPASGMSTGSAIALAWQDAPPVTTTAGIDAAAVARMHAPNPSADGGIERDALAAHANHGDIAPPTAAAAAAAAAGTGIPALRAVKIEAVDSTSPFAPDQKAQKHSVGESAAAAGRPFQPVAPVDKDRRTDAVTIADGGESKREPRPDQQQQQRSAHSVGIKREGSGGGGNETCRNDKEGGAGAGGGGRGRGNTVVAEPPEIRMFAEGPGEGGKGAKRRAGDGTVYVPGGGSASSTAHARATVGNALAIGPPKHRELNAVAYVHGAARSLGSLGAGWPEVDQRNLEHRGSVVIVVDGGGGGNGDALPPVGYLTVPAAFSVSRAVVEKRTPAPPSRASTNEGLSGGAKDSSVALAPAATGRLLRSKTSASSKAAAVQQPITIDTSDEEESGAETFEEHYEDEDSDEEYVE